MKDIVLTAEQKIALEGMLDYVNNPPKQHYTMVGYAGTGKTTLVSEFVSAYHENHGEYRRVAFATYTGKASTVLSSKLPEGYTPGYCGTIHGLIYHAMWDEERKEFIFQKRASLSVDLIIIDEGSMVGREIWKDLLSFHIPIIVVGDHGQLPPVGDDFSLMVNPDVRLEKIVRQAEGNPIIKLSMIAREQGYIRHGDYGDGVQKLYPKDAVKALDLLEYDPSNTQIICGKNQTRCTINSHIRRRLGINSALPVIGEPVICLKNNRKHFIFNGLMGKLTYVKAVGQNLLVDVNLPDGRVYRGEILAEQFGKQTTMKITDFNQYGVDLFDWAYAITCHKSQGSEYAKVLVQEEYFYREREMCARWLYTAITRAKERLILVGR